MVWASYLNSQLLSVPLYKMEMIIHTLLTGARTKRGHTIRCQARSCALDGAVGGPSCPEGVGILKCLSPKGHKLRAPTSPAPPSAQGWFKAAFLLATSLCLLSPSTEKLGSAGKSQLQLHFQTFSQSNVNTNRNNMFICRPPAKPD